MNNKDTLITQEIKRDWKLPASTPRTKFRSLFKWGQIPYYTELYLNKAAIKKKERKRTLNPDLW